MYLEPIQPRLVFVLRTSSTLMQNAARALLRRFALALTMLMLGSLLGMGSQALAEETKVVYHLTQGIPQAARAMNNVRNHLDADPKAKIVLVANGAGIDFALDGAMTPSNASFAAAIADITSKGVEIRICENTLTVRNISKDKVAMQAKIVPSGVAEATHLQLREKYAYISP